MSEEVEKENEGDVAFQEYVDRCLAAWQELFDAAKAREEVQFAMALNPEFRGMQDAGWSTAEEATRALDEYLELLNGLKPSPVRIRVALALYSYLSEATGFYEVPKNMMRIASGDDYNLWPFQHLVEKHATSGAIIAPNANRVMRDILGHAEELGLERIKSIILETFDPEIRNGYAHADYIIWSDGIRLRKRNGGHPLVVSFDDFVSKLNRAIAFFKLLQEAMMTAVRSYNPPKRIIGRLNKKDIPLPALIAFDPATGRFSISSGMGV